MSHAESPNPPSSTTQIARDLTGDMRCVRCQYNLRGLSITESCPECGVPVKATLLAVVDPLAEELAPLSMPRFTALGLLLWPAGALLATAVVWGLRAYELTPLGTWARIPFWWLWLGLAGIGLSGLSTIPLIAVHKHIPRRTRCKNLIATLCYVPMGWAFWVLHARFDVAHPQPYSDFTAAHELRPFARLTILLLCALILALLRPTARSLAARSMVVREGRVDRQPILALIGAFAVAAAGDAMLLSTRSLDVFLADLGNTLAIILIALGSVLITLGLAGLLRDGVRVYPVITANPLGLTNILSPRKGND